MNQESNAVVGRYFRICLNCAAVVFILAGVAMYLATSGTDIRLVKEDAVFGIKNQMLLMLGAVFHVTLGVYLFVPGDMPQRSLVTLWVGWCYLIYYLGMLWMKATTPFPCVQLVGWKLGANNPRIVDVFWKSFIVSLLVGSVWYLLLEWRETKRTDLEAFLKHWKLARRQGVQPATPSNRGDTGAPPETQTAEFKFSCPSCGQHIRCDTSYSGKEINCPACRKQIRVPEINPGAGDVGVVAERH